jgi:hypothetical protein
LPQKPGHMQGKTKEHPSPSLPPASTPPPPTTKGPEKSTSRSSFFVEAGPAVADPPFEPPLRIPPRSLSFPSRAGEVVLPLPAPPRPSFCLSPRGFSLAEPGIDRGSEDAAFSALAAPFSCGRFPPRSSSISPAIGRGPPRPRPSCASLLFFVRGALLLLPVRRGHRPRHHRRPPQEAYLPPLDRLHRQLKLFFGQARHPALGQVRPLAPVPRGGSATALSRCPTPPHTFSPHHPSCPPVALFLLVSNVRLVGSTSMQLSTLMSSQGLDRVATYSSGPPRYSPFDGTSAEKQRQSEVYLFDVVQNIEGALYLGVAMPSSGHSLGCELFLDMRQANFYVRNVTIAPGRVSFNGTSMPLGRPSTVSNRTPYASNPNCSPPFPSLPFSLPLPGSPAGKGENEKGEGRWAQRLRRDHPRKPASLVNLSSFL